MIVLKFLAAGLIVMAILAVGLCVQEWWQSRKKAKR